MTGFDRLSMKITTRATPDDLSMRYLLLVLLRSVELVYRKPSVEVACLKKDLAHSVLLASRRSSVVPKATKSICESSSQSSRYISHSSEPKLLLLLSLPGSQSKPTPKGSNPPPSLACFCSSMTFPKDRADGDGDEALPPPSVSDERPGAGRSEEADGM